jgi:hypothetical protein
MAILGVDLCGKPHRSLADPDYLGMLLTTSAIHEHSMEIPLRIVKLLVKTSWEASPEGRFPAGVSEDGLSKQRVSADEL